MQNIQRRQQIGSSDVCVTWKHDRTLLLRSSLDVRVCFSETPCQGINCIKNYSIFNFLCKVTALKINKDDKMAAVLQSDTGIIQEYNQTPKTYNTVYAEKCIFLTMDNCFPFQNINTVTELNDQF